MQIPLQLQHKAGESFTEPAVSSAAQSDSRWTSETWIQRAGPHENWSREAGSLYATRCCWFTKRLIAEGYLCNRTGQRHLRQSPSPEESLALLAPID